MTEKLKKLMEKNGVPALKDIISKDDILEILAEQEYRICLIELGVTEDDLQIV